jgi:hypothetical protein
MGIAGEGRETGIPFSCEMLQQEPPVGTIVALYAGHIAVQGGVLNLEGQTQAGGVRQIQRGLL